MEAYKYDILLTVLQSTLYIKFEIVYVLLDLFVENVAKIGFNIMTAVTTLSEIQ